MIEYGKMVDRMDTLISCCGQFDSQMISDNVFIHASNSKHLLLRPLDTLLKAGKLIKENKIDVIFCQDPLINGFMAWLLAKRYGVKMVVSVFGNNVFDKYWRREHWYNFIMKYVGMIVLRGADVIQTDGYNNFLILKEKYGEKVFWKPIIPSDIDKYKVESKSIINGKVRIAFVARLAKQKNIAMLVKVIGKIVDKKYPVEVVFTIAGDGPERYRFKQFEKNDNVRLVGSCNREELDVLYKDNDVLILTSYYEGFPRVFMEAAANGLAFVVVNVSGASNVVEEGKNGYIINQDDVDDFVRKLEMLITDEELLKNFSAYTLKNISKKFYSGLSIEIHQKIIDYLRRVYNI